MKVYISGAITGTDDFMERFKKAEDRLVKEGMSVVNPARVNACLPKDTAYEEYMKVSLCLLDMCEGIYLLDGWGRSCGANREYGYALAKGKAILFEGKEKSQCFVPEKGNPYPLCVGRELPECRDCQLRAEWEPEDPYGVER